MPTISNYQNSGYTDIDYLLSMVLNLDRISLYTKADYKLNKLENIKLKRLIKKRNQGVPLSQLIHKKCFYALELYINNKVLVPRPESEILVDIAFNIINQRPQQTILELATGSGAIIANLAHLAPCHYYLATDLSLGALQIAQKNLKTYNLVVDLVKSNWFSAIKADKQFDLIIANPPYIAANDPHLTDLGYEPQTALVAKNNGFSNYQIIVSQAQNYLKPKGYLLLEHGYNQRKDLVGLLQTYCFFCQSFDDLGGNHRAILAQLG